MATKAVANALTTTGLTIVPAPIVLAITGTMTCVAGSKLVTGSGTAFVTELTRWTSVNPDGKQSLLGKFLIAADTDIMEIDYVQDATYLYLKNIHVAGFSGAAGRAVNATLLDAQLVGAAKVIIMPGGNVTTPAASVPLVLTPAKNQVVPPFIAPAAVSVQSSQPFEYYQP